MAVWLECLTNSKESSMAGVELDDGDKSKRWSQKGVGGQIM